MLASPAQVAETACGMITDLITSVPDCVLGLATGSTPLDTYRGLVQRHQHGLRFDEVETFNLDEYAGLASDHPQSYHAYMAENLFDHIDIDRSDTHIPRGDADDLDEECLRFEQSIRDVGGVDHWLLGIGSNGHVAFNEPGCDPDSTTRVVDLAPETITANSRFFDRAEDVPRRALTAGISTILSADRIVLLAYGANKAEAVAEAIAGPVSPDCPASFLQTHPDCTFLLDTAAASLLLP